MDYDVSKKYKQSKANVRFLKPVLLVNVFSKCWLKHLGKNDGKNNIPRSDGTIWYSPTIDREHSRIDGCMATVSEKINSRNNKLYIQTEYMIYEFERAAYDYERLHNHLAEQIARDAIIIVDSKNLTDDQKNMLSSKRKNEQPQDEIGIRLRRFKEYQDKLNSLRSQLVQSKASLESLYQIIHANQKQIKLLDSYIDTAFWRYSSKIDRRLSWYWQGVLLKCKKPNLPACAPKSDCTKFQTLHEKRQKELNDRIIQIDSIYDKVIQLKIV